MEAVKLVSNHGYCTPLNESVEKKEAPTRRIPNPLGLPGQPGKNPMVPPKTPFYKDPNGQLRIIA